MSSSALTYNFLIADDHQLFIDGLSKLLQEETITAAIHIANNGREAVDKVLAHNIDCVIMDINMPVLNGWEALIIIKKEKPSVKVIIVSMLCNASTVNKLLLAGADAFIGKDAGKAELLKAISKVMQDEKYIGSTIAYNLYAPFSDLNLNTVDETHLTAKEIAIIRYIANGLTNKEIAATLSLSLGTVDTHRKNILAKLHLKNTAALVRYAADRNLL